ncbi:MAG: AcvB/VirJ family lysyl-phosphatidylglycerol hydrolase [Rudaea sp.]
MRRMCLLFAMMLSCLSIAHAATTPIKFGLFGNVHAIVPSHPFTQAAVLISDKNGWDARAESLAAALGDNGVMVLGIDLPYYLAQMESIGDKCSFPAGHFEEMIHWIQRDQKVQTYIYPVLVGDGAGAAFAYAVDAQAPYGTYAGLITLGWDSSLRFPKPICTADAGPMTVPDNANPGQFRLAPVKKLPNAWSPRPFASGAHTNGLLGKAQRLIAPFSQTEITPGAALADAFAKLSAPAASAVNLPQDVADLPLVEVDAQGTFANRVAIVLTGDGGWAGLDVAVAEQLSKRGIEVVGLNTLKFFWQTRKPEDAADAVTRIIGHYGAKHAQADFVILGYSFGAALAPVVINRLPAAAQARVAAQVLISPDSEAVFEIHVGDWFGSTHHEGAIPITPEIDKTKVPVICVNGADEGTDAFCPTVANKPIVKLLTLPGGHHYNGDYDKLGASIVASLPAKK